MNTMELKAKLNDKHEEVEEYIIERAKTYDSFNGTRDEIDELFYLEATGIVSEYDKEDLENHNFDLGRLKQIEEILGLL